MEKQRHVKRKITNLLRNFLPRKTCEGFVQNIANMRHNQREGHMKKCFKTNGKGESSHPRWIIGNSRSHHNGIGRSNSSTITRVTSQQDLRYFSWKSPFLKQSSRLMSLKIFLQIILINSSLKNLSLIFLFEFLNMPLQSLISSSPSRSTQQGIAYFHSFSGLSDLIFFSQAGQMSMANLATIFSDGFFTLNFLQRMF